MRPDGQISALGTLAAGGEPEALRRLRGDVRRFLDETRERLGFVAHCDCWMSAHSPDFSAALGDRGWIGMTWPTEFGGAGKTERERLVLNEELLAAGAPVAAHWFADRQIGPALIRHGTHEQRRRYLPGIIRGSGISRSACQNRTVAQTWHPCGLLLAARIQGGVSTGGRSGPAMPTPLTTCSLSCAPPPLTRRRAMPACRS